MITHSASIVNLAKALLIFQGAVDGVKRDSDNPFFKSKYADLEKVVDTARPHLQEAGIAFLQSPGAIRDNNLEMTTMLIHAESGEWMQGTGEIPLGKKDPQGAGSAQTYAQRYHLMAMLGLPPTDDDGEGAMERNRPSRPPSQPEPQKPAPTRAKPTSDANEIDLYNRLSKANSACTTKAEFSRRWSAPNIIAAQSKLSVENHARLETEKANKFAELEEKEPSNYQPPSFEGLEP